MGKDNIFSHAENEEGVIVHVDSVPGGDKCGCVCPCCHEHLLARHGELNEHGFAHHSNTRGTNLKICYMVTMYKLAEQIIKTRKKIHAPSYYGIFPEKDLEFVNVRIDNRYDREDKQPDVIATTTEGNQYIIEFTFVQKIQRRKAIDYKKLNCLEINLSNRSLDSVEKFLLEESTDRRWNNNQNYFENVEPHYRAAGIIVALKEERDCKLCDLQHMCLGMKMNNSSNPIVINNNGQRYRLCNLEQYNSVLRTRRQRLMINGGCRKQECEREKLLMADRREIHKQPEHNTNLVNSDEKTCFMCKRNLDWRNHQDCGFAHCGCYQSANVPRNTPPETAQTCKRFQMKINGSY